MQDGGEYLAAGKLAGNSQQLLQNAESELMSNLGILTRYALAAQHPQSRCLPEPDRQYGFGELPNSGNCAST